MNTTIFKSWLIKNGTSTKVASDNVSRLKKLNNGLIHSNKSTSIDEEYKIDKCNFLLSCFDNNGRNNNMKTLGIKNLPIGKASIHTYKLALNKYISFKTTTL